MKKQPNKYLSQRISNKNYEDELKRRLEASKRYHQMLSKKYLEEMEDPEEDELLEDDNELEEDEFSENENSVNDYNYGDETNADVENKVDGTPTSKETKKSNQNAKKAKSGKIQKKNRLEKVKNIKNKSVKAGKALGKGVKTLLTFIKSNPYLLIVVGVLLLFFFIVILVSLDMLTGKGSGENGVSNGGTSQSYSKACDEIAINNTSLSRTDFINKVQGYYSSSSSSSASVFSENAGSIYDIATNNNINPELVVVRAVSEGHSPGGDTNNYWGIGCTNTGGYNACHKYDSFDEGVLAFVKNISQYDSVSSMMSKYAYIGEYWYNPGSYSIGGCKYLDLIKQYMNPSRVVEVENICSGLPCDIGGGENCVKTTSEDQLAYSKWQVSTMAGSRQNIFGLVPDSCDSNSAGCTIYAQGDSRWASINLGKSSVTMGTDGCAVTSISIGISCSGTDIYLEDFNAGTFVNKLNEGNCFTPSGGIWWGCSKISEVANVQFVDSTSLIGLSNSEKNSVLEKYDLNNHFIVLGFKNSKHPRGHYVVYTSTSGDDYITKDPSGGVVSKVPIDDVRQFVIYKY